MRFLHSRVVCRAVLPTGARWAATLAVLAALACWGSAPAARAQAVQPERKRDKTDEPSKPEDLLLRTGDGVQLAVTYYAGGKGKETIPIVLLHGWKQRGAEFKGLALGLQAQGYAVVTVDLRGHGDSTRRRTANKDELLDAAKLVPAQFGKMVGEDMRAVKDFLWERNNAGQLNIDKLCLVGTEMGASVALNFAAFDAVGYGGAVYYGPLKLGRFVKALVLISPKWSSPGLPLTQAARNPVVQRDIALMIVVGKEDAKELADAKRVYGLFKNSHLEPTGDDKTDRQTLFFITLPTSLQGTKLLDPRFNLQAGIADFIYRRLVKSEESRDWTWKERKFPHQ